MEDTDLPSLLFLNGPHEGRVVELRFEGPRQLIGRHWQAAIRVEGDAAMAGRHAELLLDEAGRVVLEDLASHNGVYVDGARIQRHVLRDGDELTVGRTRFRFLAGRGA